MDFLKKNCFKLTMAVIALAGVIFGILLTVNSGIFGEMLSMEGITASEHSETAAFNTAMILMSVAMTITFLAILTKCVLSILGKNKWANLEFVGLTAVSLLIFIIATPMLISNMHDVDVSLLDAPVPGVNLALAGALSLIFMDKFLIFTTLFLFGIVPFVIALYKIGFIKEGKTIAMVLAIVGLFLAFIPFVEAMAVDTTGFSDEHSGAIIGIILRQLGIMLVFASIIAFVAMKRFNKDKVGAYAFVGGIFVGVVLILVGLIMGLPMLNQLREGADALIDGAAGAGPFAPILTTVGNMTHMAVSFSTFSNIVMLILIGLIPLAIACKKVFCKCEEK